MRAVVVRPLGVLAVVGLPVLLLPVVVITVVVLPVAVLPVVVIAVLVLPLVVVSVPGMPDTLTVPVVLVALAMTVVFLMRLRVLRRMPRAVVVAASSGFFSDSGLRGCGDTASARALGRPN